MDFGDAIKEVKAGKSATRAAWSEGAKIALYKEGDADMLGWSSDAHPRQVYHPDAPSMLAEDWGVV